ncbi:glycosyltransferase family 2 protein [Fodinibius sediminis]|uniref:Glycosyltransferase involved in cell wall bisynthesis n=1 Tax=Fodinibius sediminis TaxID=1214077 RepID=A0A521EUR1_9BACT|nr:glycosyltransferase family 2 protein [Fodinibius sediminis]SMO87634.1 Glycosyltransferase involved in cell wall bisynthesis [Fodinibius sediminis]
MCAISSFEFKVSIVIPVFNAEKFIERAVESALSQAETAEVILVEDGSEDDSYEVCQSLNENYERVQLYIHNGHINKGAGATRNLGIQKACFDYIAFLDADDFYLENRFKEAKKVLQSTADADGVYEAIGVHFESSSEKKIWINKKNKRLITTIEDGIDPDELFWEQSPIGSKGYTSLDGLTIKKESLKKVGVFNPSLRLHQDTELFMKLAMACNLYPGQVNKPVAMRGVHSDNRITKTRPVEDSITNYKKMLNSAYEWALANGYTKEAESLKYLIKYSRIHRTSAINYNRSLVNLKQYLKTLRETPTIALEGSFYINLLKFLLKYVWINVRK